MKLSEIITRAKLSLKIKDYEQAIIFLRNAIHENPNIAGFYLLLGNAYQAINDTENAIENYNIALKKNDKLIEAYNNLGVIYEKLGNLSEAKNCFKDALSVDSTYVKARNNLANIYEKTGRFEEAIEQYLGKDYKVNPDDWILETTDIIEDPSKNEKPALQKEMFPKVDLSPHQGHEEDDYFSNLDAIDSFPPIDYKLVEESPKIEKNVLSAPETETIPGNSNNFKIEKKVIDGIEFDIIG